MPIQTLIDLSKLKTPYSGLGQFSLQYGKHIAEQQELPFYWNFLVPKGHRDRFGSEWNYIQVSLAKRFLPGISRKYDLWHAIHQDSPYFPSERNTPYILTIHDLNFLEEKQGFKVRRSLRNLQYKVNRAAFITFISEYTAKVAAENLDLGNIPRRVIYNGVDINSSPGAKRPEFLPNAPFLFTIGMILKKKNFHVLIEFIRHLPEYILVIAGDKNDEYAAQLARKIRSLKLDNRILMPGIINEEEKVYLYRHCEAFLFPSLVEGFGMPVIEAMRFGKPVFCSRKASLPEVGSDLAFYWNSFDPEEMTSFFSSRMAFYRKNRNDLSEKNKNHSYRFNWSDSIQQYLEVYNEVAGSHRKMNRNKTPFIERSTPSTDAAVESQTDTVRVLHLSSEKTWRGGEQQIAYLIDELNEAGVKNFIACRKDSSFEKYCRDRSWPFYALNFKPPVDPVTAWEIGRICRKNRIDILHMHTSYGHTLGVLSTVLGNEVQMVLARRVDNPIRNNWFTKWKYNHPRIRRIIAVSDAIKEILNRKIHDKSKIITIHSGIDVSRFRMNDKNDFFRENYRLDPETLVIGNTSALSAHKDYPTFLKVALYLRERGIMAKFFIIGAGKLEENIREMIREMDLQDDVFMTGFMKNTAEILNGLDIFLMSSRTEGLGTSILDAFASGVPVVATRAGGIPEMVIHEKTGLLSAVGDYKGLGDQILRIASEPGLRDQLTANAHRFVRENFTKQRTAEKTLQVYHDILSGTS